MDRGGPVRFIFMPCCVTTVGMDFRLYALHKETRLVTKLNGQFLFDSYYSKNSFIN